MSQTSLPHLAEWKLPKVSRRVSAVSEVNPPASPIPPLLLAHSVLLAGLSAIPEEAAANNAFFIAVLAGVGAVVALHFAYLRSAVGRFALPVGLAICLGKILLGAWHYTHFIDRSYFDGAIHQDFHYLWDYEWMHVSLTEVRLHWLENGLLSPLPHDFLGHNKNAFLNAYTALVYYLGGVHPLNITVWNAVHSIYTAALIVAIAARLEGARWRTILVFALAAIQPFTLISSIFERDIVGQTLVTLSAYLLISNAKKPARLLLAVPISCALVYCMRETYIFIPIITATVILVFGYGGRILRRTGTRWACLVALSILTAIAMPLALQLNERNESAVSGFATAGALVSFPFRVLKGIVGPFPWMQVFIEENTEYLPQDFLQHVVNLGIYLVVVPQMKNVWRKSRSLDPMFCFAFLLFVVGIYGPGIHSQYVSLGTVLLIPMASLVNVGRLRAGMFWSGAMFLLGNVIYSGAGLAGSNSFRDFIQ